MNIVVATFTFSGDEDLTQVGIQSVDLLRKLYPQHKIINCFIDDETHPFNQPFKSSEETYYMTSSFNRHGNLNGYDALIGESKVMSELAKRFEADWVVKRDADTIIMSLQPLEECDIDYFGTMPFDDREWVWGSCCAYTAKAICAVNDML